MKNEDYVANEELQVPFDNRPSEGEISYLVISSNLTRKAAFRSPIKIVLTYNRVSSNCEAHVLNVSCRYQNLCSIGFQVYQLDSIIFEKGEYAISSYSPVLTKQDRNKT